jgi:predicted acetyltransferase
MKRLIFITIMFVGVTALAQLKENTGLGQVLKRHSMRRVEKPVETRVEDGVIVREYANGTIETSAVSVFVTSEKVKTQVNSLVEDQKTLKAAKELIQRMRLQQEDVKNLSDSEIIKVADDVLETSGKDTLAAGVIGALIGAAAAGGAAVIGKDKGKEKEVGDERKAG